MNQFEKTPILAFTITERELTLSSLCSIIIDPWWMDLVENDSHHRVYHHLTLSPLCGAPQFLFLESTLVDELCEKTPIAFTNLIQWYCHLYAITVLLVI